MERILFGDNQFFGINHMSDDQARNMAQRFQTNDAVLSLIDEVQNLGIRVFMCTTHERVSQIADSFRANPQKYRQLQIYPCMPYAHKYANAVSESGIVEAVRKFLPSEAPLMSLLKNGVAVASQDVDYLIRSLVDAEMKAFVNLQTPVIFLQNVVTDLLLGLGFHESFVTFADHVRKRHGAEPGFITMNLPRLADALHKVGLNKPIICANINKIGFRMCGGVDAYERAIRDGGFTAVAMSVFASGAIPPEEAIEYVGTQPNIKSIVFGASSASNVRATKSLIERVSQRCAELKPSLRG